MAGWSSGSGRPGEYSRREREGERAFSSGAVAASRPASERVEQGGGALKKG